MMCSGEGGLKEAGAKPFGAQQFYFSQINWFSHLSSETRREFNQEGLQKQKKKQVSNNVQRVVA
jgi:hypothetical protein